MKSVLIIEDETAAAVNLQAILCKVLPQHEVITILESVEEAVEFFEDESQPTPDLVFLDIHLADGESFRIFDKVEITSPIIFTTAYDEYALRAFKVNSIDY
ncbi:MAG: response regulator, partial [Alistipes sp.]|nr:response regulator [Alistipes sp.]